MLLTRGLRRLRDSPPPPPLYITGREKTTLYECYVCVTMYISFFDVFIGNGLDEIYTRAFGDIFFMIAFERHLRALWLPGTMWRLIGVAGVGYSK